MEALLKDRDSIYEMPNRRKTKPALLRFYRAQTSAYIFGAFLSFVMSAGFISHAVLEFYAATGKAAFSPLVERVTATVVRAGVERFNQLHYPAIIYRFSYKGSEYEFCSVADELGKFAGGAIAERFRHKYPTGSEVPVIIWVPFGKLQPIFLLTKENEAYFQSAAYCYLAIGISIFLAFLYFCYGVRECHRSEES